MNEIKDDTNEKKLHYYLQKTIDGSTEEGKYAYDGGIMLIELGYEVATIFNVCWSYTVTMLHIHTTTF